jgi:biopolymer transport protein ExbD
MAKKRTAFTDATLDLVPIMNLVTILIPFLLMSAQFVTLAVIDSTLPAIVNTPTLTEPDPNEDKLNLSLLITSKGFTIAGGDKVLEKDNLETGPIVACLDAACLSPESYDYQGLTKRLALLKDRYGDEENVILVPDPNTNYEVLVLTMDAARDDQADVDDEGKARLLFPNVVIAGGVE